MNTLFEHPSPSMIPVVEAFLYLDTVGMGTASELRAASSGEAGEEKAATADKTARVSQEEMSSAIAKAAAEGLAQGERQALARHENDLEQERKRVADTIVEFQRQRTDYFGKVEIELVHLALAIAAKILHRESQVDRMVVAGLVKVMIERLQQKTKIIVRLRPEDAESWRHYFRDNANVQVVEDLALEPKACRLETELGIADLGLDAQLKEVEQGFFDLLAQRPEAK
jgi:flagellar biosynthesis/type III secretory pathway protein FliH